MGRPQARWLQETKSVEVRAEHDRFWVEVDLSDDSDDFDTSCKGVQVRLEENGTVYVSTQIGSGRTLQTRKLSFDEFFRTMQDAFFKHTEITKSLGGYRKDPA